MEESTAYFWANAVIKMHTIKLKISEEFSLRKCAFSIG
jgi:hypothetical protein